MTSLHQYSSLEYDEASIIGLHARCTLQTCFGWRQFFLQRRRTAGWIFFPADFRLNIFFQRWRPISAATESSYLVCIKAVISVSDTRLTLWMQWLNCQPRLNHDRVGERVVFNARPRLCNLLWQADLGAPFGRLFPNSHWSTVSKYCWDGTGMQFLPSILSMFKLTTTKMRLQCKKKWTFTTETNSGIVQMTQHILNVIR